MNGAAPTMQATHMRGPRRALHLRARVLSLNLRSYKARRRKCFSGLGGTERPGPRCSDIGPGSKR